jgi:hypothetical protein
VREGAATCNGEVVPGRFTETVTVGECLHIEDVIAGRVEGPAAEQPEA